MTQNIYSAIMGHNPSQFKALNNPVENVSWMDAILFCNKLSQLSNLDSVYKIEEKDVFVDLTVKGFRLPRELEWEYCCRANNNDVNNSNVEDIAWFNRNSQRSTHEVGQRQANGFGLYDMLGNVWEWCNDWYQVRYPREPLESYSGPILGFERILRGGSWADQLDCIRPDFRHRKFPLSRESIQGFRVVLQK